MMILNTVKSRQLLHATMRADTRISDFITLMKPRVMSLVVFTGIVGMALAPGHLHPLIQTIVIFCIALGSGAAGALNMWLERDTDALMQRTKNRPIPAGRIAPQHARNFALISAAISVIAMAIIANYVAAFLLFGAIVFYVVIYTMWLKPRTPMNIVIGGAAGALPPVIGWAAVTGNITLEPVILFLIIFLWTPPHFWALALVKSDDYKNVNIPMLPLIAGAQRTMCEMFIYTLLLFAVTLLPYALGMSGALYAIGALALGAGFVYQAWRLWYYDNLDYAMPVFRYSLFYLFWIFTLLVVDRLF